MTEEAGGSDPGPDRIRSIAVHREDVANALEATLRSDRDVVLRATPPFSGRMRARLHAVDTDGDGDAENTGESDVPAPLHVDPRDLVEDVPPYPEPDDTATEYPDADLEARRERHAEAVESWRERVREGVGSTVEIEVDGDARAVDVVALG
ncbi:MULTISPECIES: hypothetical protein [Halorubrum]|uniref:DUF8009 domain-containing protein n=1 Tax=Halorubrum sodomense TaxID=35743 RepID=A0A1I6HCP0_HALSD|nr:MULTISPECIES: hypothetical protein [Halorubrum]TKX55897.1 hypothetical protein EXE42_02585 [Halorubrum sp. SP3]TKX71317.1 hypothetical protein EXE45_00115 [Halorubrum sp. SP9]SFR52275.1 hypothetical protein SAMN04487937_2676 [Halorubrum sodomense]